MKIPYPIHAQNEIGLTAISAHKASELISRYNIYFRLYCIPNDEYGYRNFNFNLIDNRIYKLDNYKNFDRQYNQIKSLRMDFESTVYFYTDNKEDSELVENRLLLAHYILIKRCKTVLRQQIRVNMREYNKGRYSNRKQAIAIAYSMVSRKYSNCKKIFKMIREAKLT